MDALNRHLRSETGVECARIVDRGKGSGGGDGYDMSVITMSSMGIESEEQKGPILSKRRQSGGGGGGGADMWSGVTL
jgi:hypothetical protein